MDKILIKETQLTSFELDPYPFWLLRAPPLNKGRPWSYDSFISLRTFLALSFFSSPPLCGGSFPPRGKCGMQNFGCSPVFREAPLSSLLSPT